VTNPRGPVPVRFLVTDPPGVWLEGSDLAAWLRRPVVISTQSEYAEIVEQVVPQIVEQIARRLEAMILGYLDGSEPEAIVRIRSLEEELGRG
jgi:hypothetical protein